MAGSEKPARGELGCIGDWVGGGKIFVPRGNGEVIRVRKVLVWLKTKRPNNGEEGLGALAGGRRNSSGGGRGECVTGEE